MEICHRIFSRLLSFDYSSARMKILVTTGSCLLFAILYYVTAKVSRDCSSSYRSLQIADTFTWHCTTGRIVFGCFGAFTGTRTLFYDTELFNDVVYGTNQITIFSVCAILGFFIFESFILAFCFFATRLYSTTMIVHHFIAVYALLMCLYQDVGHFFVTAIIFLDMSIPISALTWTLAKCDLKRTLLWKGFQLLLIHVFHCRNVVESYIFYVIYKNWTYMCSELSTIAVFTLLSVMVPVTFFLTPYWTFQLTDIYNRQIVKERRFHKHIE